MSNKEIELNNVKINLTDEQIKEIIEKYGKKDDKPEIGEWYWYVNDCYYVGYSNYLTYSYDEAHYKAGNYYKTKEEAEKVAELKKKYDTALANIKRNIKESFVPDWKNGSTSKYFVYYDHCVSRLFIDSYHNFSTQPYTIPCFATRADAKKSIEQNADDWKIVLGVE